MSPGVGATRRSSHRATAVVPLEISLHMHVSEMQVQGHARFQISGRSNELLVQFYLQPKTDWEHISRIIWGGRKDAGRRRQNFDKALKALRALLGANGVRPDFIGQENGVYWLDYREIDTVVFALLPEP